MERQVIGFRPVFSFVAPNHRQMRNDIISRNHAPCERVVVISDWMQTEADQRQSFRIIAYSNGGFALSQPICNIATFTAMISQNPMPTVTGLGTPSQ